MGSSHRKGYYGEMKAVELLAPRFPSAERIRLRGVKDEGDVSLPHSALEVKYRSGGQPMVLSSGLNEAVVEAGNAGARWPILLHSRVRRPVEEWYWVMRGVDGRDLLADWVEQRQRIAELEGQLEVLRSAIVDAMKPE